MDFIRNTVTDYLAVYPEGDKIKLKIRISKCTDFILRKLISDIENSEYNLFPFYINVVNSIISLIKDEIIYRFTIKYQTENKAHLQVNAPEYIPLSSNACSFVPLAAVPKLKLSNWSIKHIKNMLHNPYIIKENRSITIDHILANPKIKPMYSRDIMIKLIKKSSYDFSYNDSTCVITLLR
jgi:hypothetical protein